MNFYCFSFFGFVEIEAPFGAFIFETQNCNPQPATRNPQPATRKSFFTNGVTNHVSQLLLVNLLSNF